MLQFSRRDDPLNTGQFHLAIENLRIVWTFIFEAAGSKVKRTVSYNFRFHMS